MNRCTTYIKKSPCKNCPYRTDAPLQLWSVEEFKDLINNDNDWFGKVYHCHKNDDSVCRGWLINQDRRNFPSLALRISLMKNNISRIYLDRLYSPVKMYSTIQEMAL